MATRHRRGLDLLKDDWLELCGNFGRLLQRLAGGAWIAQGDNEPELRKIRSGGFGPITLVFF